MSEQVTTKSFAEQIAEKKKKKRIIISLVSLGLVLMLALAVIIMAVINVNLIPSVISKPSAIYFNNYSSVQFDSDDKAYTDFLKEYDKAFNASYLTALFSGRLNGYEIVEDHRTSLPEDVTSGTYVTFIYRNKKITLTEPNGKTYYSKYNTNYSIDFDQVTFKLNSEDKLSDVTMYLKYNWNTSNSGSGKDYYAEIKIKANTHNLYKIYNDAMN